MRTRYDFIKPAKSPESKTKRGEPYPDLCTFRIEEFRFTARPERYKLLQRDVDRFDILMFRKYKVAAYDDLILWLNNVPSVHFLQAGDELLLPSREDLDRFYTRESV